MGAVLPAVALYVFVSMFSDGAESSSRWKILFIAIVSGLISAVVRQLIWGVAGAVIGLILALAVIAIGLIFWCKVDRKAALNIVGAYCAFSVVLAVVITYLSGVAAAN